MRAIFFVMMNGHFQKQALHFHNKSWDSSNMSGSKKPSWAGTWCTELTISQVSFWVLPRLHQVQTSTPNWKLKLTEGGWQSHGPQNWCSMEKKKNHSTDELYLFRGLQERHQPAEIWIRARLLSALCQTQTHIEHSGCSGIFTTRPRN